MNNYKIIGLALTLLVAQPAFAAVEYFRFEGILFGSAEDIPIFGGPDYGFTDGQSVQFDFEVDTSSDAVGKTDFGADDYFQVNYLGGTLEGAPVETFGVTHIETGFSYSQLFIDAYLSVGTDVPETQFLPAFTDINFWDVGGTLSVIFNISTAAPQKVGLVSLTYRSTTPFSTAIPLPASWLLFASAFTLVRGAARFGSSR